MATERIIDKPEEQPEESGIKRAYIVTKKGIQELAGDDARQAIEDIEKESNLTPYTFFENGMPVYIAIKDGKNGNVQPIVFPESKDYGITAPELFGVVVTLPTDIAQFLRMRQREKPSLFDQLKKYTAVGLPIAVLAFIIFLLSMTLGG